MLNNDSVNLGYQKVNIYSMFDYVKGYDIMINEKSPNTYITEALEFCKANQIKTLRQLYLADENLYSDFLQAVCLRRLSPSNLDPAEGVKEALGLIEKLWEKDNASTTTH